MSAPMTPGALAERSLSAYDNVTRLALPTSSSPDFSLADAYEVAAAMRQSRIARGERPRGYKIGFTNRSIWTRYAVDGPIWGPVWDSTLTLIDGTHATVSLAGLVQPRLEPEIVFGFAHSPRAGMTEAELATCLSWVAHGFEIVQSHYDDWRFQAPDTIVDGALHGRLIVGPRVPVSSFEALGESLAALRLELFRGDTKIDEGVGSVVLDGPLTALRLWVDAMAGQSHGWLIASGDVVTTGTLTDAWPLLPGQTWTTVLSDSRLAGLHLHIEN